MNGEGGAVRDGGVATKEDDFVDDLTGGGFPYQVQVIFLDDAIVVLDHPYVFVTVTLHHPLIINK